MKFRGIASLILFYSSPINAFPTDEVVWSYPPIVQGNRMLLIQGTPRCITSCEDVIDGSLQWYSQACAKLIGTKPPTNVTPAMKAGTPGSEAGWVKTSDFKDVPWRYGKITLLYEINERGRVEACRILRSSGSLDFDQVACAAMTKRARYRPALDAAGHPIRIRDVHTINFAP